MKRMNQVLVGLFSAALLNSMAAAGLIHRYSFNDGTGKDSAGTVQGKTVGTGATIADGKLSLKNDPVTTDPAKLSYFEFAGPILPKSGSATIMFWITCKDVAHYSRVVDIGESVNGEGNAFFYFAPRTVDESSRAAITATDVSGRIPVDNPRIDDDKPHMVAVVIDGQAKKMQVFIDGKAGIAAQDLGENTLDRINPKNNYLGRSSFDVDPGLTAAIDEFRLYDHALTASEISAAMAAGPNAVATAPATQPGR
jgi:hypothetical protein